MSSSDSPKLARFVETAAWFVLGIAVVPALQSVGGWWLNSGTGVLRAVLVLGALGVFSTLWRSGRPWARACPLWAGASSGSMVVLFWIGPGSIWPIVLVIAAGLSAGAVFGGALLGSAVTRFRRQP
jgi:hypothetical protein